MANHTLLLSLIALTATPFCRQAPAVPALQQESAGAVYAAPVPDTAGIFHAYQQHLANHAAVGCDVVNQQPCWRMLTAVDDVRGTIPGGSSPDALGFGAVFYYRTDSGFAFYCLSAPGEGVTSPPPSLFSTVIVPDAY